MHLNSRLRHALTGAAALAVLAGTAAAQPAAPSIPTVAAFPAAAANSVAILNDQTSGARLLGSGELDGVLVYGADGVRQAAWTGGEINAVDVRDGVVAALDRQADELRVYDAAGRSLLAAPLAFGFPGEGVCLYKSPRDGALYAVILGEGGEIDQWLLHPLAGGKLGGLLVRRMRLASEAGHCVADDASGDLYVTEDAIGIWKFDADPESDPVPTIVDIVRFGHVAGEVGGVALVNGGQGANYLIASNLGGGDFNLYDRDADDRFVGRFRLEGVESAAGLNATLTGLGPAHPGGVLAVADDRKQGAAYRLASWPAIAAAMGVRPGAPQPPAAPGTLALVQASVETQPVASDGDAADDPAIWVDPADPAASLIIGTNKKLGLDVYDLSGRILQTLPDGKMNNVDLRDGFRLDGKPVTLVTASDRTHKAIAIYVLDAASRRLRNVADGLLPTGLDDPYGLCMYRNRAGKTYVLINDTDGRMRQWELLARPGGKVAARLVREFAFDTQAEGCVADDETGALYVAEEDVGLWRMGAEPRAGAARKMIAAVADNRALKADLEGVGLYDAGGGRGYIVVSSQGDNSYALFRREGDNAYVGSFAVTASGPNGVDGISETDGLEVTARSLGPAFPRGAMIAQDGRNVAPPERQNFKIVSWDAIAAALKLD